MNNVRQLLRDPLWYVAVVAVLTAVTAYVRGLWWLAGAVALLWGAWLLWQGVRPEDDGRAAAPDDVARLQGYLEQTLAYKDQVNRLIKTTGNEFNRHRLGQLADQLAACSGAVEELVRRLTSLRQDDLLRYDLSHVPEAIADLERRTGQETNAVIAVQLEGLLAARRNQFALLQRLQNTARQTEIQIEHTLTLLGTIYTQVLIGQSTNDIADYGRISASIDEEVHRLTDYLEALGEVRGEYGTHLAHVD